MIYTTIATWIVLFWQIVKWPLLIWGFFLLFGCGETEEEINQSRASLDATTCTNLHADKSKAS